MAKDTKNASKEAINTPKEANKSSTKLNSDIKTEKIEKKPSFRIFSFNNVLITLFIAYMVHTASTFYTLLNPDTVVQRADESGKTYPVWSPLWKRGSTLSMSVYLSKHSSVPQSVSKEYKIFETSNIKFDWTMESDVHKFNANLTMDAIPEHLWTALETNNALYLHYIIKNSEAPQKLYASSSVVKYTIPDKKAKRDVRYLVKDWPFLGSFVPIDPEIIRGVAASTRGNSKTKYIGYWKPVASLHLVADWTDWPKPTTPYVVRSGLRLDSSKQNYYPVVYTDQLGLTQDKLIQINQTMRTDVEIVESEYPNGVINENGGVLPLEIHIAPMSVSRWQFNAQMELALQSQKKIGASEKDIDDMRYMLTETPPLLLAVTLTVSLLHILFDILAFKNDVQFWRNQKSMKGLSLRTVIMELFSTTIITAYLHDNSASMLVLAPSFVGVVVQIWKVHRALKMNRNQSSEETKSTNEFDSKALNTMSIVLVPLVLGYTGYTLVFEKHAGFYSWFVKSLASSVYAFGFAMMTPQLFINYKLKSVAHLPWRFLIYRSLNTFIDDLFAFIIRMPTMHRAAVFRDDLVFFIYLYQRWIYPVDQDRLESPSGESLENDGTETKKNK